MARSSHADALAVAALSVALATGGAARAGVATADVLTESGPVRGIAGATRTASSAFPSPRRRSGRCASRRPRRVAPWEATLDADALPPACPQLASENGAESTRRGLPAPLGVPAAVPARRARRTR